MLQLCSSFFWNKANVVMSDLIRYCVSSSISLVFECYFHFQKIQYSD